MICTPELATLLKKLRLPSIRTTKMAFTSVPCLINPTPHRSSNISAATLPDRSLPLHALILMTAISLLFIITVMKTINSLPKQYRPLISLLSWHSISQKNTLKWYDTTAFMPDTVNPTIVCTEQFQKKNIKYIFPSTAGVIASCTRLDMIPWNAQAAAQPCFLWSYISTTDPFLCTNYTKGLCENTTVVLLLSFTSSTPFLSMIQSIYLMAKWRQLLWNALQRQNLQRN